MRMKKIIALLLALAMVFALTACSSSDYKKAVEAMENCRYAAAAAAFKALGDYQDSAARAQECSYYAVLELLDAGDYAAAVPALEALGDYQDCAELLSEAKDALLEQQLEGKWVSEPFDLTGFFLDGLAYGLGIGGDDETMVDDTAFSAIEVIFTLTIADGSAAYSVDGEAWAATTAQLYGEIYAWLVNYLEAALEKEFSSLGYSMEEAMQMLGVQNVEELIEMSSGISLNDMLDEMMAELGDTSNFETTEYVFVENGSIEFGSDSVSYDADTDTLTASAPEMDADIVFHRA